MAHCASCEGNCFNSSHPSLLASTIDATIGRSFDEAIRISIRASASCCFMRGLFFRWMARGAFCLQSSWRQSWAVIESKLLNHQCPVNNFHPLLYSNAMCIVHVLCVMCMCMSARSCWLIAPRTATDYNHALCWCCTWHVLQRDIFCNALDSYLMTILCSV